MQRKLTKTKGTGSQLSACSFIKMLFFLPGHAVLSMHLINLNISK